MRRQQSRDSCDSVAFARPRARRALTGLQDLDVRPWVPYTTWTKRRRRTGQPRGMGGSFPRSQSCDIPRMAVFCRKSTTLYSNLKKKCSTSGVPEPHSPTL